VGFKPDLDDQLVSFKQCFDTVGLVIWPVKIIPEMTYSVLSGMLNPTHSHTQSLGRQQQAVEQVPVDAAWLLCTAVPLCLLYCMPYWCWGCKNTTCSISWLELV